MIRNPMMLVLASAVFLTAVACTAQQPAISTTDRAIAFPGAEGFGKYTTGGRGGKVWVVTNLNDAGPGSLREAVEAKGPRIIVFAVSGTIELASKLAVKNGDITIAGQSAPGDGICLKNYSFIVEADNVIVRYMRSRLGAEKHQEDDAMGGTRQHNNIIIDHCSASWSVDETASFYHNRNFTMQWCIVAESLNNSVHSKGEHGYGGIWGGESATFHHNLLADHKSRNPRFSGSATTPNQPDELVDFCNNVIFNWGENSSYGGEKGSYNMVCNYYKPGPATKGKIADRIIQPWSPLGKFYVFGNVVEGNASVSINNWNGGVQTVSLDSAKALAPFEVEKVKYTSAKDAYAAVLKYAGANKFRDAADQRVVEQARTGKATTGKNRNGIIDSPEDVGGWPELRSLPAPIDSDKDGMPDEWETAHGLNPNNANDAAAYTLDKQYTNLEMYLNGLVADVNK
ncbi:pectate lyase [Chitinophagaceae bacterium 26-R-25]|nr:pectate lyase [Chitinophagaceae bacterium 26-R-25]